MAKNLYADLLGLPDPDRGPRYASADAYDENGQRVSASGESHSGQVRMAYRLARRYTDELMHVHGLGWHAWDGRRWAEDQYGHARRAVLDVLREALAESISDKQLRADVARCESDSGISGVLGIAAALVEFAATVRDLDADPHLLNTANGTLDLHTLQLRPHDPWDRITKVTAAAYSPDAAGPEWDKFLARVLPEEEVRGFLQRLVGVALLGQVVEHVFPIATGVGANGKSTAYGALLHALGDYGHTAEADLFMAAKHNTNAATPAKFALRGVRLAVVSETERDRPLAESLMKALTGGDPITARPLYGHLVTFQPSHAPLMVTNFLPKVHGDDPAIWRRIRVVPFSIVVPEEERDVQLGDRLALEADAVLAWAVEGLSLYQTGGLAAPATVLAATDAYHRSSDAVVRFVEEECVTNYPAMHVAMAELWERWCHWRTDAGAEELSKRPSAKPSTGSGSERTRATQGCAFAAESGCNH